MPMPHQKIGRSIQFGRLTVLRLQMSSPKINRDSAIFARKLRLRTKAERAISRPNLGNGAPTSSVMSIFISAAER